SAGAMQITGHGGGSGTASSETGVVIINGAQVTDAGSGVLAITGTGGTGSGGGNEGVRLTNAQVSATRARTRSITATPTGAGNAPALSADSASTISAAGTADNIPLASNNGASVAGTVTTPGGLLLDGTAAGNFTLNTATNNVARLAATLSGNLT